MLEDYESEESVDEPIIKAIVEYINLNKSYTGTMAELIDVLSIQKFTAAMLSKKIRSNAEILESKFDIEVVFTRNRSSRTVTISKRCDGDDGI